MLLDIIRRFSINGIVIITTISRLLDNIFVTLLSKVELVKTANEKTILIY